MELIISEERRKRDWYYLDGAYISKEGDKICAKIIGGQLPNPETIRLQRQIQQKRLPLNQRGLYRTEPDPITLALWNDWQARQSVG